MMLRIVSFLKPLFGFLWIFDLDKYLGDKRSPAKAGLFVFYNKVPTATLYTVLDAE